MFERSLKTSNSMYNYLKTIKDHEEKTSTLIQNVIYICRITQITPDHPSTHVGYPHQCPGSFRDSKLCDNCGQLFSSDADVCRNCISPQCLDDGFVELTGAVLNAGNFRE
jgi:hypothetical protein